MTSDTPQIAAFFDMDGTICAPVFLNEKGQKVIGFDMDGWKAYCKAMKLHTYDKCPLVMPVLAYAARLKKAGASLHILTRVLSEVEKKAKWAYFDRNGLRSTFDTLNFVDTDEEKTPFIERYAEKHNLPIGNCILVEDMFYNLVTATEHGIQSVHVSHILTNTEEQICQIGAFQP